jgi:uncharacterized protein YceK
MERKMKMKTTIKILMLWPLVFLAGCGSLVRSTDAKTGAIVYSPSPAWSNTVAQVQGAIGAIPNEVPYAPIAKDVALGILGLATGVVTLIAKAKSTQAADQSKAADILAQTVVKTSQTQAALTAAIDQDHVSAVKEHLDNNTL